LGLLAAELIEPPEDGAHALERRRIVETWIVAHRGGIAEQAEPFFRELEEDVVFTWKVAVNRGGAVFDAFGDLPDRNVLESFGDEELARRVEDRSPDRLAVAFVSLFDAHVFSTKV
jgi:hypothetical protein